MLFRRNRGLLPQKTKPTSFAARAEDLGALRDAVVDAAGVGAGFWISYLFALFYFAIAAGAVTHRDLLLENPVKLPFLNVDLPLKAFFVLGPLIFLIVHVYVLLHFVLLADKIGTFNAELEAQVGRDDAKARLRRQLPINIFVQSLAGPRQIRTGTIGFLLWLIIVISLVVGPIALLILFQLQFLPYHSEWITMWQRIAVVIDLVLLWFLWPPIARGDASRLRLSEFKRLKVQAWLLVSFLPVLLVVTIATFPGEWLEENLPAVRLTTWAAWILPSVQAIQAPTLHELLVAGQVNYVTGRPESLWSNVLVLPNFEGGDHVSLRGRSLEGAVLVGAHLRNADFTGASLAGAKFNLADLHEAKFGFDWSRGGDPGFFPIGYNKDVGCSKDIGCTQLQGADFSSAQLQGASLTAAQLQGAVLTQPSAPGWPSMERWDGAELRHSYVWRTYPPSNVNGALITTPEPEPKYFRLDCPGGDCNWSETSYAALKSLIENSVPLGGQRDQALRRIAVLGMPPFVADEALAKAWTNLANESARSVGSYFDTLSEKLKKIGCAVDGAPYVITGLMRDTGSSVMREVGLSMACYSIFALGITSQRRLRLPLPSSTRRSAPVPAGCRPRIRQSCERYATGAFLRRLSRESRNRALADAIAAREFGKRSAFGPAATGLVLLCRRQFRGPAHMLPTLLRPAAAFSGAGADKIALHVRQSAENGNHQPPGAGAGVGPRFRERAELRLGVHDTFDDLEQVEGAARQAVDPRHRHHITRVQFVEHPVEFAPVGPRARHPLAVDVFGGASGGAQLLKLAVERLPYGADAGIAD
jgi:Pentapeptide repeats (8 copies)